MTAVSHRRSAPPEVLAAIGGAWVLALALQALGQAELLGHDRLVDGMEGGLPWWVALGLFLLAWQTMSPP